MKQTLICEECDKLVVIDFDKRECPVCHRYHPNCGAKPDRPKDTPESILSRLEGAVADDDFESTLKAMDDYFSWVLSWGYSVQNIKELNCRYKDIYRMLVNKLSKDDTARGLMAEDPLISRYMDTRLPGV